MKGKRYSQEQKVYALKQVEAGTQVVEVCRQLGVSVATFYQWKRTLGSMGISELNELRVLRDEDTITEARAAANALLDEDVHLHQAPLLAREVSGIESSVRADYMEKS